MTLKIVSALFAASLFLGAPVMALAAPAQCRDAHGKFITCPPPKPIVAQCRDAHGKFIKCAPAPVKPKQCRDPKTGKFIKC